MDITDIALKCKKQQLITKGVQALQQFKLRTIYTVKTCINERNYWLHEKHISTL